MVIIDNISLAPQEIIICAPSRICAHEQDYVVQLLLWSVIIFDESHVAICNVLSSQEYRLHLAQWYHPCQPGEHTSGLFVRMISSQSTDGAGGRALAMLNGGLNPEWHTSPAISGCQHTHHKHQTASKTFLLPDPLLSFQESLRYPCQWHHPRQPREHAGDLRVRVIAPRQKTD